MTTSKKYLAIIHTYEMATDDKGRFIGDIYAFASKKKRDEFVAAGNPMRTEKGYRTAITRREALKIAPEFFWS